MPGLYGFSSNANISVYNTTGLYNVGSGNVTIQGNVGVSSTTGLYQSLGNPTILSSAQQLLSLLSNNGSVTFTLDPATSYTTVEAFAIGGNGGGGGGNSIVSIIGDITAYGQTGGIPIYSVLSNVGTVAGTYGNISYVPVLRVASNGRVMSATTTIAYGNANVAGYLLGNVTIGNVTTNHISSGNIVNTGNLYSGSAYIAGNLYVNGNTVTRFVSNTVQLQLIANGNIPATSTTTGALQSYGGLGVQGNIWGNAVYTDNYFYANGQPFVSSLYSNVNVAAYIPTDPTITGIQANIGAYEINNNANVGSIYNHLNTLDANVGSYELATNASLSTLTNNLQTLNANVGAYEIYANANAATQATSINTINANLGTVVTNLQTLNANVGAYETWANANFSTSTYSNTNVAAYMPSYLATYNGNIGTLLSNVVTIFTSPGVLSIPNLGGAAITANVLLVGGGGGGYGPGTNLPGGGGGGGNVQLLTGITLSSGTSYPVTVGAGGSGTTPGGSTTFAGYTAVGGGAGQAGVTPAPMVGGAGGTAGVPNTGGGGGQWPGTGNPVYISGAGGGAGQGGAGTAGTTAPAPSVGPGGQGGSGGNGGAGVPITIAGITGFYGGGGGGAAAASTPTAFIATAGTGGTGGGGTGARSNAPFTGPGGAVNQLPTPGTDGTGGGGGGGGGWPGMGGSYGGAGVVIVQYNVVGYPNLVVSNTYTVTSGIQWANGVSYATTVTGTYGNANVAAYIPTDPTFTGYLTFANANAATQATSINTINANLGAYQTYANANAATQATSINTINANLGAYQSYANTSINTINANLGAYQTYANANAATQATSINTINANLGAYQSYANTSINTINANLGAFEIYANSSINTINANLGTLYLGNLSTQANLGAFQTYANLHFADQTYSNANVAAYLPIYGGNIALGNITNDGHHWQFNADGSETYPSATAVTTAAGKMWYDSTNGSWNLGMGGGNVTQQVGEELFVYGKASSAIADSPLQIVYKTGVVGASGVITFAPTIAGITNDDVIVGVATENIALNATGRVTCFGIVHGITTNGTAYGETWADGDVIWYNPVTGNPTKTKPVAPYVKCQIGTVINAGSGGSGSFQVEIIHGTSLGGTDQNAQITSPTAAQILTYDATSQYWKNTNLNAGTNINVTTASDGNITVNNTYGNTQVAAYLPTDPTITSIQANIGGSETYANVTFATKTALQTLDANVGAFETYANATFSTGGGSSYGNSNVAAYLPVYGGNILTSNVITSNGVFWSNGVPYSTGGGGTYGNTQVAAYIPIDPTITGIQANLGAYQNYANISINTINANLGAFETYANANFITSGSTYGNANVAAYLPTYSGNLGVLGGNINLNSNNRIGPVWQSSLNTLAFIGTEKSNGVALVFEGNTGTAPIDQMFYVNKDNAQIRANNANYIWTFDKVGNLTLPGNTSAINYANGVSILSGTGGSGTYGNTQVNAYLNTTQSTPNVFNPFLLSGM